LENEYSKQLEQYVSQVSKMVLINFRELKPSYDLAVRLDSVDDELQNIIKICELQISIKIKDFIKKVIKKAKQVNAFNKRSIEQSLSSTVKKGLSIPVSKTMEESMQFFVSDNVRLIKSINSDLLGQAQEIVYSGVRNGVGFSSLADDFGKAFTISKKRARIIARDQINKLNADLTRHRHLVLGIENYKWSTAKDERVRISHKVLEGKICSYIDTGVYKKNVNDKWNSRNEIKATLSQPGQDVLCRCTSLAIVNI
jgi:SPP1 gp7 family putative phage head morphogenesis protein